MCLRNGSSRLKINYDWRTVIRKVDFAYNIHFGVYPQKYANVRTVHTKAIAQATSLLGWAKFQ